MKYMENAQRIGKWLVVNKNPRRKGRKTDVWDVYNNEGENLGQIEWRTGWRQYVYFPEVCVYLACSCLLDIATFIQEEMEARKNG